MSQFYLFDVPEKCKDTYIQIGKLINATITFGESDKSRYCPMYADQPGLTVDMQQLIAMFERMFRASLVEHGYNTDNYTYVYFGCEDTAST